MGKKGTSKREKNGKKMDLSICIFCAYILLSRIVFFAFILFCFCFLPGKKQKKKVKRKSKIHAKEMQIDKSIFVPMFPLFDFPCFPC